MKKPVEEMLKSGCKRVLFAADAKVYDKLKKCVKGRGMRMVDALNESIELWIKENGK